MQKEDKNEYRKTKKATKKHLDLSARIIIEQHLNNGDSFRSIAIELSKDPSTISKEIRRHSIIRERSADALPLFPVQTIMIVQSRGQIYAMSCICAVIMNVGANVSSAENSDAAMSVNFTNQENVKN